jgi:hypothetical protein
MVSVFGSGVAGKKRQAPSARTIVPRKADQAMKALQKDRHACLVDSGLLPERIAKKKGLLDALRKVIS